MSNSQDSSVPSILTVIVGQCPINTSVVLVFSGTHSTPAPRSSVAGMVSLKPSGKLQVAYKTWRCGLLACTNGKWAYLVHPSCSCRQTAVPSVKWQQKFHPENVKRKPSELGPEIPPAGPVAAGLSKRHWGGTVWVMSLQPAM